MRSDVKTDNRVKMQFHKHAFLMILAVAPVLALITTIVLWATGVFSTKFPRLPNRSYVLAQTGETEPQTLQELLHSAAPNIDSLLKNPSIARELQNAGSLINIIDSRLSLNNLRALDEQLTQRLDESNETLETLVS